MARQHGFRDIAGDSFVYLETVGSAAIGIDDTDGDKLKFTVETGSGSIPSVGAQLEIDPAVNGDVTVNPNGTGNLSLTTGNAEIVAGDVNLTVGDVNVTAGDVNITAGNLNIPHTNAAGTEGTINFGADRVINDFPGTNVAQGRNIFVGSAAGNLGLTPGGNANNSGFGTNSLSVLTTGFDNTALGSQTLAELTTGTQNVAIGSDAGVNSGGGTGLVSGSRNILIGLAAGASYTAGESENILLNANGVAAENNTARIGNGTGAGVQQLNRCFISGIRGITTGVADAIAVLIDSADQLGTVSSSLRYKQNIKDLEKDSEIIYDLRPVKFNYRAHPTVPAWGLIAEEVEQIFPQLVVYDKEDQPESVKYHELPVLLLNEIQKLYKRIQELEAHLSN